MGAGVREKILEETVRLETGAWAAGSPGEVRFLGEEHPVRRHAGVSKQLEGTSGVGGKTGREASRPDVLWLPGLGVSTLKRASEDSLVGKHHDCHCFSKVTLRSVWRKKANQGRRDVHGKTL